MVTDVERNYEDLIDDDKEDVGRGHCTWLLSKLGLAASGGGQPGRPSCCDLVGQLQLLASTGQAGLAGLASKTFLLLCY